MKSIKLLLVVGAFLAAHGASATCTHGNGNGFRDGQTNPPSTASSGGSDQTRTDGSTTRRTN